MRLRELCRTFPGHLPSAFLALSPFDLGLCLEVMEAGEAYDARQIARLPPGSVTATVRIG